MQLLIDTQIFIWSVMDSKNLGAKARQIMLDAVQVFVSAASIWERCPLHRTKFKVDSKVVELQTFQTL